MQVVATDDTTVHLKAWDEFDHHSVMLQAAGVRLVELGMRSARSTTSTGSSRPRQPERGLHRQLPLLRRHADDHVDDGHAARGLSSLQREINESFLTVFT